MIPVRKDPEAVDAKLIERLGIDVSKWARSRRKRAGLLNVHYLRFERFFVLLASKGDHRFFQEERGYKDVRRDSITFLGHSIGYKQDSNGRWHPSVRIHPKTYRDLKAHFLEQSGRSSARDLLTELNGLPFERYAPVRAQLLCLFRAINGARRMRGLDLLPRGGLWLRRSPVRVFK